MGKLFIYILGTVTVSLFYFPFGLTFLPEFLNSKNIFAAIGLPLIIWDSLSSRTIKIPEKFIIAICIAIVYSLIGHIIIDIHRSTDVSYANYFVSFFVWTFGGYTVCSLIYKSHGRLDLKHIAFYLTSACVLQCVLALIIDRSPVFQFYVNQYIDQGQDFLQKVNRLYGIGASLDNAGVRFCTVLILLSGVLVNDFQIRESKLQMTFLISSFFIITLVGNLISRTTFIGAGMGFVYILFGSGILSPIIKYISIKFNALFIFILTVVVIIAVYFYNTDDNFYSQVRFGFEGFFNWVEKGEWYTASTDKLNSKMWVWPQDTKTWLIGTGLFDGWVYGTDIGYCRHILYNGFLGFSVFCIFFIYNPLVFINRYKDYWFVFLCFMSLSFIIWIKVSTDIYQIYALLYGIDLLKTNNFEQENT